MSEIKRKGLEFAINQIGKAFNAYDTLVGDTFTPGTYIYDFENNLIRARGSNIFNDYDLSKKNPYSNISPQFNTLNSDDISNFVIQGGDLTVKSELASFANTGSWSPEFYSPIATEGWGIYDYNAWSNYVPAYDSTGIANTSLLIYNTLSEPGNGVSRVSFEYPIRYSGYGFTYSRVPLFNYGMWCSFKNFSESSTVDEIGFILPKSQFHGLLDINPFNGIPNDLMIYSHRFLISESSTSPIVLSGNMGTLGVSDVLVPLAIDISECNLSGLTDVTLKKDFYRINVKLPDSAVFNQNSWFHFLIYWGSNDSFIQDSKIQYISKSLNSLDLYINASTEELITYPKKSFFNYSIKNKIGFSKSGIFDTSVYLYDKNNSLFENSESKYVPKFKPFRYKIDENINGSSTGSTNSLIGYFTLEENFYMPVVLAVRNTGQYYDRPNVSIEIFSGNQIHESDAPDYWNEFSFWPSVPDTYSVISKIICKKAKLTNNTQNIDQLLNDIDIVYIDNVVDNVIKRGISDEFFSRTFNRTLFQTTLNIRNQDYNKFFTLPSQKLLTIHTDYNTDQIQFINQFSDPNSKQYLVLHNYLKLPKTPRLLNNTEPIAYQFNQYAANVISYFGVLPSTTNVAGFSSTSLYSKNYSFDLGTQFEIYLETTNDELNNHSIDNANGLENDYCFRLKFKTTDNQFVTKDLFVNASKFYISKTEFDERIKNGLSTEGYFTPETIKQIQDFSVHSYAGLIPDLKFGEFRTILNKYNAPKDSSRLTEVEYENLLLSENPNLTKDEIISAKSGFSLTNSFYIEDLSSPTNSYKNLNKVGLTISKYANQINSKWIDNSSFLYGDELNSDIIRAKNIKDLRYDSFIISSTGYTNSDNSIQNLENYKNQQIISNQSSVINQTSYLGKQLIDSNKIAVRVYCDVDQNIKSFKVRLRNTSDYMNNFSTIRSEVWSDYNDLPYELLSIGSSLNLSDISSVQEDKYFYIDYKFFKGVKYWIVLNISQNPPLYDPIINGLASISNTTVTGMYNGKNDSYANFERYLIGSEIGFGSSAGSAITQWYEISSIGSSTSLNISGSGFTAEKLDYSIKYNFDIAIVENSSIGASTNLAKYSSIGWTAYSGTAFIQFFKPDDELYASFNKNNDNYTYLLPPVNKYREQNGYKVNEYWSFTNDEFYIPKLLNLYARSVFLSNFNFIGSGTSNTNSIKVTSENFNNGLLIGLGISQSPQFSSGTSITNIIYNRSTDEYDLHLSKKIIANFENLSVGIASSQNIFIKRAKDIHLLLTYKNSSGYAKTTITLEKSPTWITKWYAKNKQKFNVLQSFEKANCITATHDLNFEDFDVNGQVKYINGFTEGEFTPKSSLGTTFDFRFESSNGIRVFLNDSNNSVLDNWFNNASIGNSFSYTLNNISEKIKFLVEFNHFELPFEKGALLKGYWKKQNESSWNLLNDSFYADNFEFVKLVDELPIFNIEFLNVSDKIETFNNISLGSPSSDRIIFRTI